MIGVIKTATRWIALVTLMLSTIGVDIPTVNVEFYANPASGYAWEMEMDRSDVLALVGTYYKEGTNSASSGKSGGKRYFDFKSLHPGIVNITFSYTRQNTIYSHVASQYVYTYEVSENGKITLLEVK